jgi:hypothetical protein
MDQAATCFYGAYHDFIMTETGSGLLYWEEDLALSTTGSPTLVVTWLDVENGPTTAVNRSTVQMQFDLVTGIVTYIWVTLDAAGGSTNSGGDGMLVGFSPAGESPPALEFTYASLSTPVSVTMPEKFPLSLGLTGDAIINQSFSLVTTRIEAGAFLGINLFSVAAPTVPGIPLAVLGGPADCEAYLSVGSSILNIIDAGNNFTLTVGVPNNFSLSGATFHSQSVMFSPNLLSLPSLFIDTRSSNGVTIVIGSF